MAGAGQSYPADALEQSIEGDVTVRYDVDTDGQVMNARVVRSHPAGVFDAAALNAVQSWRFNAPRVDGIPQMSTGLESTLTFKLGETGAYDDY